MALVADRLGKAVVRYGLSFTRVWLLSAYAIVPRDGYFYTYTEGSRY